MTEKDLKKQITDLKAEIKRLHKNTLGLNFEDKPEDVVALCESKIPVLKQITKNIVRTKKNDSNIIIEGDNYHSLSVLNYTHKQTFDVIYIDPPYNTGNKDFIYNDKFIDREDSYRHSKWLSFMKKRLTLAHRLLKTDGVIFLSIDDNEYAHLKILCDKIFGDENYLTTLHIQVRYNDKSINEEKPFKPLIEYVLVYAKNSKIFLPNRPESAYTLDKFIYEIAELKSGHKIKVGNNDVTVFKKGEWKILKHDLGSESFLKETWISGSIYTTMSYGKVFQKVVEPRVSLDGLGTLYKVHGRGEDGLGYRYYTGPAKAGATRGKMYSGVPLSRVEEISSEDGAKKYSPITTFYDLSADFGNIRHEGGIGFNSGKKPIKLISQLIQMHKNKDALVLDFFAGSGSTGHAVLDLNSKDEGNRKFILCTNNESKIAEKITLPRIRNVVKEMQLKNIAPNSVRYYKTDLVDVEHLRKISDEARIKVTYQTGEMIAMRENTLNEIEKNDWWQIFESENKVTAIYFKEDKSKLNELITKLEKMKKQTALYIFSWGKNENKGEYSTGQIRIEDIPEPILEVYKEINRL